MGPPPTNCIHRVRCSLLSPREETRFFSPGLPITFDLEGASSRVERARALLASEGFTNPVAAQARFPLPPGRWLCRPCPEGEFPPNPPEEISRVFRGRDFTTASGQLHPLHAALILGLCGPAYYAQDRPSVWSEARLGRRLVLHRPAGYYEE